MGSVAVGCSYSTLRVKVDCDSVLVIFQELLASHHTDHDIGNISGFTFRIYHGIILRRSIEQKFVTS
jgi:hypothetical protein